MPTRKITNFIAIALAILLSAAFVTLKPAPAEDSGIYGTATIAPTCGGPVQIGKNNCGPKPYQATVTIYSVKPNSAVIAIYPLPKGSVPVTGKVTGFTTDSLGEFRVNLSPGQYVIRKDEGSLPSLPDVLVTVTTGQFTKVGLSFDSGLR